MSSIHSKTPPLGTLNSFHCNRISIVHTDDNQSQSRNKKESGI